MKFNLTKFIAVVSQIAPVILAAVPGGDRIGPLIPDITRAITAAEQMKGATGAAKKAHVLTIVKGSVATANATGKVTLDPAEVERVASDGVDAVIGTVHVIEGATVVKGAAAPPPSGA